MGSFGLPMGLQRIISFLICITNIANPAPIINVFGWCDNKIRYPTSFILMCLVWWEIVI